MSRDALLEPDEPPPFSHSRPDGTSDFLILVDHASWCIPRRLHDLGLPPSELRRHIAWDIGALAVAERVSAALDASLIAQNYSRLVIDCNRDPDVDSSIPTVSEWSGIPGNRDLSPADRLARRAAVFDPYHDHIRDVLDARQAAGRATILVTQHSMTDCYMGVSRLMHAAILYNRDRRFAAVMLEMLRREPDIIVGDNEPYFVSDETDYAIPRYGEARGLLHVEIEIRQDLIGDDVGQMQWAQRITTALRAAQQALPRAL